MHRVWQPLHHPQKFFDVGMPASRLPHQPNPAPHQRPPCKDRSFLVCGTRPFVRQARRPRRLSLSLQSCSSKTTSSRGVAAQTSDAFRRSSCRSEHQQCLEKLIRSSLFFPGNFMSCSLECSSECKPYLSSRHGDWSSA